MRNDELTLTIACGKSRKEMTWQNRQTTWGQLAKKLSTTKHTSETEAEYAAMTRDDRQNVKDIGGFVGGEMRENTMRRKKDCVRSRQILSLDMDYGSPGTEADYAMMFEWECLAHTTHSHTRGKPRWRMFFPMSRPVMPEEYEAVARMVANQFDIELFDDSTYEVNRLMFWPSTSRDGEFLCWRHEGTLLDPDEILSWYGDWHDQSEWPISSRTKVTIKKNVAHQENPLLKQNLIGDFCRAYDIPAVIDKYLPDVYIPNERDERRYTYAQGSTANGLVLYGLEGQNERPPYVFAYSNHSTDPAYQQDCNAFDLVRLHLFPGMDTKASMDAMHNLLVSDGRVREQFDLRTERTASDDFQDSEDELQRLQQDYSEQGNALRLKDMYYTRMRYNPSLGWCIWDGEIWVTNAEQYAMLNVMRLADVWHDEAERAMQLAPKPEKGAKKEDWPPEYKAACAMYAWAKQCRGRTNQAHTLTSAQTLMLLPDASDFDDDPWLLNTPDGVIDLRTGEVKPHHADYMCTKITAAAPDWNAPHPLWDGFLDRITGGDRDLERYLQDVAGMALVGKVYEEGVVICYGPGGNGKSTLFEIWKSVMGDYALTVRNEMVMGAKNGNEVAGQAQLRKMRLVITSELEAGQTMSNSMLKRLTSRDDIQANIKYFEPVTFTPTHTLVLHTNHLPNLKSVDDGTRRRLAIVPILARIKPEEKVADFAGELLKTEAGAVLAWMIEGAKRFYARGMKVEKPAVVKKASEEYMQEADALGLFLSEMCDTGAGLTVKQSVLSQAYADWMKRNDMAPLGKVTFIRVLRERGFEQKRTEKERLIEGLGLKREFEEEL